MSSPDVAPSPYLSARQVASLVGVEVDTLYLWKREGKGPQPFRMGKFLRYHRSEVEEWLKKLETPA